MTSSVAATLALAAASVVLAACGTSSNPAFATGDCLDLKPAAAAKSGRTPKRVPCGAKKARSKLAGTGAPAACQGSERTLEDPGDKNIAYCVRALNR